MVQGDNILPGGYGYFTGTLNLYDLTTNISDVDIQSVHFTDGTTWGN